MLELRGALQDKVAVLRFLRDLERHIGMKDFALQQHFDIVLGFDIGTSQAQIMMVLF